MDDDGSGGYDENDGNGDDDDEMTTRKTGMGTVGQRRESVPVWDRVDRDVLCDGVNNTLGDREALCQVDESVGHRRRWVCACGWGLGMLRGRYSFKSGGCWHG